MARRHLVALIGAALVVVAAACGGSSEGGSSTGTSTAGGAQLDAPVDLGLLWEVKGESAAAIDDYQNGAQMAIDAINAAGGIGGQPIQATRVTAPPLDPQRTTAGYLQVLDGDPAAVIGFASSSQMLAAMSEVNRSGVPTLTPASSDNALRFGADGSEYAWLLSPYTNALSDVAVSYLTEELKLTQIGLMGTNESYGTTGVAASAAALQAEGLQPYAERTFAPNATDLTEQVLAMKGAQAVIDWAFPNPLAVQLKQFQQNGMAIPTVSGGSATVAVNGGLATGEAIDDLYAVVPCNPAGTDHPPLKAFAADYEKRFGAKATNLAAIAHDAVYVVKAAIERAGSTDHAAVNQALSEVTVTQGVVCATEYKADGSHIMNHEIAVAKFDASGASRTLKVYEDDPLPPATR